MLEFKSSETKCTASILCYMLDLGATVSAISPCVAVVGLYIVPSNRERERERERELDVEYAVAFGKSDSELIFANLPKMGWRMAPVTPVMQFYIYLQAKKTAGVCRITERFVHKL